MPTWIWVLLGLTTLGFVLWLLEDRLRLDVTERFGKALAILFILAIVAGLVLSFVNADWR